jgi:hypothetical protein
MKTTERTPLDNDGLPKLDGKHPQIADADAKWLAEVVEASMMLATAQVLIEERFASGCGSAEEHHNHAQLAYQWKRAADRVYRLTGVEPFEQDPYRGLQSLTDALDESYPEVDDPVGAFGTIYDYNMLALYFDVEPVDYPKRTLEDLAGDLEAEGARVEDVPLLLATDGKGIHLYDDGGCGWEVEADLAFPFTVEKLEAECKRVSAKAAKHRAEREREREREEAEVDGEYITSPVELAEHLGVDLAHAASGATREAADARKHFKGPIDALVKAMLAESLKEVEERISRRLYKDTECGAWLSFILSDKPSQYPNTAIGINIGSVVEGSDVEVGPYTAYFPFAAQQLDDIIEQVEREVSEREREEAEVDGEDPVCQTCARLEDECECAPQEKIRITYKPATDAPLPEGLIVTDAGLGGLNCDRVTVEDVARSIRQARFQLDLIPDLNPDRYKGIEKALDFVFDLVKD